MKAVKKEKITLAGLAREVALLRSFVIGQALQDPEGEYKPEFIEKVLKEIDEPACFEFTTPEDFLKNLKDYGE